MANLVTAFTVATDGLQFPLGPFKVLPLRYFQLFHPLFYYLSRCLESYIGDRRGGGISDFEFLRLSRPLDFFRASCPKSQASLLAVSLSLHVSSLFCIEHKAVGQDIYERLFPVSSRFHSYEIYINIHPLIFSLLHSNVFTDLKLILRIVIKFALLCHNHERFCRLQRTGGRRLRMARLHLMISLN